MNLAEKSSEKAAFWVFLQIALRTAQKALFQYFIL
jgi:hypothetical protein